MPPPLSSAIPQLDQPWRTEDEGPRECESRSAEAWVQSAFPA